MSEKFLLNNTTSVLVNRLQRNESIKCIQMVYNLFFVIFLSLGEHDVYNIRHDSSVAKGCAMNRNINCFLVFYQVFTNLKNDSNNSCQI